MQQVELPRTWPAAKAVNVAAFEGLRCLARLVHNPAIG